MAAIPKFEYHQPTTLTQAMELLVSLGSGARPLLGGTDLIGKMRSGALKVEHVVSLNRIGELRRLEWNPASGLVIGAGTRIVDVQRFAPVIEGYPELTHACSVHSTNQIRNMATVVGNITNASPCADTAGPLLCRDAVVHMTGPKGDRQVPLIEFFKGPGSVDLTPGEIATSIAVPPPIAGMSAKYIRMSARSCVDIAAASATAMLLLGPDKTVLEARLALGAVAPVPLRLHEVEALLQGKPLTPEIFAEAVDLGTKIASPIDDIRGTARYRRKLVHVLLDRTLGHCRDEQEGGAR